jgi:hypothetical protein
MALAIRYDAAVTRCATNGMKLANIDSPEVEAAVRVHSETIYPLGTFWVEGQSASSCTIFQRLLLTNQYARRTVDCGLAYFFYCEMTGLKDLFLKF